jgi:hypothetical protein
MRLKSAAILCESVRQLLRDGLIQCPQRAFAKRSQADLLRICATFIFLTEEGIRRAERLLAAGRERNCSGKPDKDAAGPCNFQSAYAADSAFSRSRPTRSARLCWERR